MQPLLAVLGTALVYGTDVFCAIVLRPALTSIDDDALVAVMGSVHRYGDRRTALYTQVSAPINRQLTAAADAGRPLPSGRVLQAKWDSIINARAVLQGLAVAALCVALMG
ncbi:hypothetical protein [Mycobacterium europaeum]|uniref:hypothetical protein n=1 Tax=Mycobacterium europaeum TaxID=761804 RepID=UPI00115327EB|nr:hypothetical protein [Mycobacterium europaeum]